jgi:hypothetical protein
MKNPFMPRFRMDHKLPPGSFWRRMKWHGNDVDVYFFKDRDDREGDSYMCRRSDTNYDYSSGDAGRLPFDIGFSDDTPLEEQVERYREILRLTEAYLQWKGLKEDPNQELRDFFKKETDAKHLELSPE